MKTTPQKRQTLNKLMAFRQALKECRQGELDFFALLTLGPEMQRHPQEPDNVFRYRLLLQWAQRYACRA